METELSYNDIKAEDKRDFSVKQSIKNWNSITWFCYYCQHDFMEYKDFKSHQQSQHETSNMENICYQCNDCNEQFFSYASFLNHIRLLHYESLKLCCDACSEFLPDFEELAMHRDKHNEISENLYPNVYHCTLCETVHSNEKELKNHIQLIHNFFCSEDATKGLFSKEQTTISLSSSDMGDAPSSMSSIHLKEEYNESTQTFQCGKCVTSFSSESELKNHLNTHTSERPHVCNICSVSFSLRRSLRRHMITHSEDRPHKCELCGMGYKRKAGKVVHIRTHTGERPYNCNICSESFSTSKYLKHHMVTHSEERPYKCDLCDNYFKRKRDVKSHMTEHTGERPYVCSVCSANFHSVSNLNRHVKVHFKDRPYKCDICEKTFKRKENKADHMNTHSKERPFKCEICERKFYKKSELTCHVRMHNEGPVECQICKNAYRNRKLLNLHIQTHSGERPHKCEICDSTFKTKQCRKVHMRIHTGERRYKCELCEKRYPTAQRLKDHMFSHTGERPYKCNMCPKSYSKAKNLRIHKSAVHPENRPCNCTMCKETFLNEQDLKQPSTSKRNKKRMQNFSSELKRLLAAEVKARPRVWDVTDRLHSRRDAIEQSWLEISEVVGRPVTECKSAWGSLKESSRYHTKVSRKGKSGDAGGEMLDEPSLVEAVDWEFAEDMAFLPNNSQKRKTFQTYEVSPSPNDLDSSSFVDTDSAATYDYIPTAKKKKQQENISMELMDRVGALVESQQKLHELRAKAVTTGSSFQQALTTFDWLLNKLPQSVAEQMCEEITQMLLSKVSEERAKQAETEK